jgi:type IV pilus biogenesis protein CpaD/CtpE
LVASPFVIVAKAFGDRTEAPDFVTRVSWHGICSAAHPVRVVLSLVASLVLAGCADQPITSDQLEPGGMLRDVRDQAAFSVDHAEPQRASFVQLSTVLAAEASGALRDADRFDAEVGTVHLHVRADGLATARSVSFRWIHGDTATIERGVLVDGRHLALASSVPIAPHQVGPWRVEVLAQPADAAEPPEVLFTREFTIE